MLSLTELVPRAAGGFARAMVGPIGMGLTAGDRGVEPMSWRTSPHGPPSAA